MQLNEYQSLAHLSAIYDPDVGMAYNVAALASEAGELCAAYAKWLRGDFSDAEMLIRMKGELGDILWHLSEMAGLLDLSLEEVAQANLSKLSNRRANGAIRGDGDNR